MSVLNFLKEQYKQAQPNLDRFINRASDRYNPFDKDYQRSVGRAFSPFLDKGYENKPQGFRPSNFINPAIGDVAKGAGAAWETLTIDPYRKTATALDNTVFGGKPLKQSLANEFVKPTPLERQGISLEDAFDVPKETLKGLSRPIYNTTSLVEKTNPLRHLLPQDTKDGIKSQEQSVREFLAIDEDANEVAKILGIAGELVTTAAAYQVGAGGGQSIVSGASTSLLPTLGKFLPAAGRVSGITAAGQLTMDPGGNRPARALTDIAVGTLFEGVASVFNKIRIQIKNGNMTEEARQILGVKKNATPKEIKDAYNIAVKKYHPDLKGDPIKFQQVKIARDIISGKVSPQEGTQLIADLMVTPPRGVPQTQPAPAPTPGQPLALQAPQQGITPTVAPQAVAPAVQNAGQALLGKPAIQLGAATPGPKVSLPVVGQERSTAKTAINKLIRPEQTDVTQNEGVALRKQLRDQARGSKIGFKEGRQEGVSITKDRIQSSNARKELMSNINKELRAIKPRTVGGRPEGKFTAEIQKQLTEIKDITKMRKSDAQAEIMSNIEKYPDTEMPIEVFDRNERLRLAGMGDMTDVELQSALADVKSLKETGRTVRGVKEFNRQTDIQRNIEASIDALTSNVGVRPKTSLASEKSRPIKTLDDMQHGLDTLLRKLSINDKSSEEFGGVLNQVIAQPIHNASRAFKISYEQTTNKVQSELDRIYSTDNKGVVKKNIKSNTKQESLGTFKYGNNRGTDELILSQNEAYNYWMKLQDPTQAASFEHMGWTDEIKKAVTDYIRPEVMEWAKWQLNTFYPEYRTGINAVYSDRSGIDLPFIENYSPVSKDFEGAKDSGSLLVKEARRYASTKNKSLKSRTESASDILPQDGDSVLVEHIDTMEHYKAMDAAIRDVRAVTNNPEFKAAVEQYHGKSAYKRLHNIIEDKARGGVDLAKQVQELDKFRGNFTKAVLALNPRVFMKQLASIPAYAAEMPAGEWAKGLAQFMTNPVKYSKQITDSPVMRARYSQGFTRDIAQGMHQSKYRALSGKDDFVNQLMFPVKWGDEGAILAGGWPVYNWNLKQNLAAGMGQEEAELSALKTFEQATNRSQQSADIEAQGELQRGGSFAKLFTMFQSSRNQYYRIASNAITDLRAGRGSKKENLKALAISWIVLPSLFQFIADGGNWDNKRQARAAIMGPLNGILMFGDAAETGMKIVSGEQRSGNGVSPIEDVWFTAQDMLEKVNKFTSGENITMEDLGWFMDKMADVGSKYVGAPYNPVKNTLKGAYTGYKGQAEAGFPIAQDPINLFKATFFGERGTKEGSKYRNNAKLGELQESGVTNELKGGYESGTAEYDRVIGDREARKDVDRANAEGFSLSDLNPFSKDKASGEDEFGVTEDDTGQFQYTNVDGDRKRTGNYEDAKEAAHKKIFKDSGQTSERFEDTIYYMEAGEVKTTDAIKYDIAVATASFQKDKQTLERSDNWGGLMELYPKRNEQLRSQIQKLDPFVDAAEITRLENYIDDNLLSIAKLKAGEYTGQKSGGGGGGKGRSLKVGGPALKTSVPGGSSGTISLGFKGLQGGGSSKAAKPKKRSGRL